MTRARHGRHPQYHTSADNLDFVRPKVLAASLSLCVDIVDVLEHDGQYVNQNPKCEPQLGRRGLYRAIGGERDRAGFEQALLWVLNLSDGQHGLFDVAERSRLALWDSPPCDPGTFGARAVERSYSGKLW